MPAFCEGFAEEQNEANNLLYSGSFSESLAMSENIVRRAEATGDSNALAIALLQVSESHYYLGQREATLPPLHRALQIYEARNDLEGIGRSYYSIAYYYERTDPSRMIEILNTGSVYAEQAHDEKLMMNIANATGVAHWGLGKYDQAIISLEKSIALAEKNNWESARASANQNMALIHLNQGRPEQALVYNQKALLVFKNDGASHNYAVGLGNSGNAYRDLREFEKGLACYEEALAIHQKNNAPRAESINLTNIADVYLTLQEWDQARSYLLKAMAINERMENYRDLSLALSSLGNLALQRGNIIDARDNFLRSLKVSESLGDPYLIDGPEISMAIIEIEEGNINEADQWLNSAENHAQATGKTQNLGIILSLRSEIEAQKKNWDSAIAIMTKAIAIHEQIHLRTHTYHWHTLLAQYMAANGDQDSALLHFESSLQLIDHLDAMIATDRFRVGFFQDVALIYHQYAIWLAGRGEVMNAMEILDQGRSRVLALRLVHSRDRGKFSPEQKSALNRISMLQRRLQQAVGTIEENEEIFKQLGAAEWDYEKASGTENSTEISTKFAEMIELKATTLHLSYSAQNDTLAVFSLNAGKAACRMIPDAEAVLARARMYADLMADPDSGPRSRIAGHNLFKVLMGPELSGFHGDHILINPDSDLWTFPFVALITDQDQYLGEIVSLGLTPSWSVLRTLANLPSPSGRQALILANSNFSTGIANNKPLEKLGSVESEANSVSSHFQESVMMLNASESDFKNLTLNQFDPLHFATHTVTNVKSPLRSSIVLGLAEGEDGLLQAREIHHLPLDCNLVVVSGCKSGSGKIVFGEGLLGITHSILRAGSRCVVMSRWDVTDEGAAHFMAEFYLALEDHEIVEAVSIAQQKLRESERWSHPYYWAPFYVAGDGRIVLKNCVAGDTNLQKTMIGFAVVFGILGSLWIALRERRKNY